MAVARHFVLVFYSVSVFCIFSWRYSLLDVQTALQLAGRGLLFLGLLALFAWVVESFLCPVGPVTLENPTDEAHNRAKEVQARKEQQHHQIVKSSAYQEAVLKPREEKRKKKEDDLHRMKLSQSFPLGGRAARKRKQLETPRQASSHKDLPREKKVIILPDEPPENAEGVVKIALRCLSGRTVHRRFFKICPCSVLLDWLHMSGYSPTIYTLYTSYPRRPLVTHTDLTLEEAGIIMDTVLNVDEKDPSTT